MTTTHAPNLDRHALIERYRRNRARSTALFDLLSGEQAYYSQPISLRHPLVFYEGHLPAFSFNTVVKKALGGASIDPALETLFARGIDPDGAEVEATTAERNRERWPDRATVQGFAREADRRILEALQGADLDRPGDAFLDRAEAVFAILEHEAMHQETLLYLWHQLPLEQKRRPDGYQPRVDGASPRQEWVAVPSGSASLGVARGEVAFAWDNETGPHVVPTAGFDIERHDVTNAAFIEFVLAGGYTTRAYWADEDWQWIEAQQIRHPHFWVQQESAWFWRGMFDLLPLPMSWPVYVSYAEASAYARWRGTRLPTEAEFSRAAFGSPEGERDYPWGSAAPAPAHGVFDFSSWDPEPAGSHPNGRSAWGIDDLVGNGWKWTSTPFAPFPGFEPRPCYPEYSADFFDQKHFVLKGASPATARELIRPTFRNWFRPRYPYVYATFRCARNAVR